MTCPKCHHDKSIVMETRTVEGVIYRRRSCKNCGCRFHTAEAVYVGSLPREPRIGYKRPDRVKDEPAPTFNTAALATTWK